MIYGDLYRALWRRRVLVLLGTVLCVAATLALTFQEQKLYTAAATVRVEPVDRSSANDTFEASQRLSRSYAEIYTQGAVLVGMARYMPGQPPPQRDELAANQLKDLDLLEVKGIAASPGRAAVIANAGARALEDFGARERLLQVKPAAQPSSPSSPNVVLRALLALVGGFILSAGVALIADALMQPIPDADHVEQALGVPVLAVIPRLHLSVASEATRTGERGSPSDAEELEVSDVGTAWRGPRRVERLGKDSA